MGILSAPQVETVRGRRWLVFITAIVENLMFAAPLFGWASLRQMLMDFGWKSDACIADCKNYDAENWEISYVANLTETEKVKYDELTGSEKTARWNPNGCNTAYIDDYALSAWYDPANSLDRTGENDWTMSCNAQNAILNRYFTIGTSCLSGSTMLYGLIMDKWGCRALRLGGMAAFAISCLLFSIASKEPRSMGWIVLPAVLCNGMGGILYIFTGFQLANFFPGGRSTVCALLIGSYNGSALVYPILYALYETGYLTFTGCMALHGGIAVATFIEAWVNTPWEPIPEPGSVDQGNDENKNESAPSDEEIPSFMSVLFSIPCILSLVTMCITVLRLSMYIGQMSLWFTNAAKLNGITEENDIKALVEKNVMIFGFIQILCVVWAYPIGWVLDRRLDDCKPNPEPQLHVRSNQDDENLPLTSKSKEIDTDDSRTYSRVQKLRNTRDAYIITVICLLVFGFLVILQANIKIQIVTFILHTVIRTFIHSSAAGIYVNVFHMSHIGKLTGLGSIAGAIFSLIMDPLMNVVQGPLAGNPYYLNLILLFASLVGAFLPVYLHFFANKTEKDYKEAERNTVS